MSFYCHKSQTTEQLLFGTSIHTTLTDLDFCYHVKSTLHIFFEIVYFSFNILNCWSKRHNSLSSFWKILDNSRGPFLFNFICSTVKQSILILQDLALQKKRCLETLLYVSEVENLLQVKHRLISEWLGHIDSVSPGKSIPYYLKEIIMTKLSIIICKSLTIINLLFIRMCSRSLRIGHSTSQSAGPYSKVFTGKTPSKHRRGSTGYYKYRTSREPTL